VIKYMGQAAEQYGGELFNNQLSEYSSDMSTA
jgi:hypothetical protein